MQAIDLSSPTTIVAALALLVAVTAVVVATMARRSLARVRRSTDILVTDGDTSSLVELVAHRTQDIHALATDLAALSARLDATRVELSTALRHVAVVRYDAFGDMGGRMSFSSALLDDNGDGLVITSIHGRSETRTYMKPVRSGASDQLSPEELQAISQAMVR